MRRWMAVVGVLWVAFGAGLVWGQARTGAIYGTVTDPDGNPLPGVTVELTSSVTARMTAVTDVDGSYRFPSLPPGADYVLRFTLQGFQPVVREGVSVLVGVNTRVDVTLRPGAVEEVVVRGAVPVVDVKSTKVAVNLSRDVLQELPTARDPWVMLELAPGIMVDRQNVGGSESGQQSLYFARGSGFGDNQWNLDGVNITDPAAIGASPTYYDFDAFEEMQITAGSNDVEALTGGVILNFVTRRAGNRFVGGGRFYWTTHNLGSDNTKCIEESGGQCVRYATKSGDELFIPRSRGNKTWDVKDFGVNVGGPIVKDRLWFWGSYGGSRIDMLVPTNPISPVPDFLKDIYDPERVAAHDKTQLNNVAAKLNAQFGRHSLEGFFFWGDKTKQGRGLGPTRPPETTWDQSGPTPLIKLQDEFFASDNLFLSLKGAFIGLGFKLEPKGGRQTFAWQDAALVWHGTYLYYQTDRPTWQFTGQAIYYRSEFLGGSHEIKIGAEFRRADVTSESGFGTGETYLERPTRANPNRHFAIFGTPSFSDYWKDRISGYLQDTYSVGRLVLNLGVRVDAQRQGFKDTARPVTHPILRRDLGAEEVRITGGQRLFTWTTVSPRIGATLDLMGTGKTLLKGSFAIYPSEQDVDAGYYMSNTSREVLYLFTDRNGNHRPDPDESLIGPLGFCNLLLSFPCDQENPLRSLFAVDSQVKSPKTMEFTVGFEHQLLTDLGIGITGYYRRLWDFPWPYPYFPVLAEGDIYGCWAPIPDAVVPPEHMKFGDPRVYTCEGTPAQFLYTNRPDYENTYMGVELRFTKRMSQRWMLMGSVTLQDWNRKFKSRLANYDPTNFPQLEKADMAYQTSGSGKTEIWPNSHWMVKLGGVVQLPLDINLGASFVAREGYIFPIVYRFNTLDFGVCNEFDCGDKDVLTNEFGKDRLPTFWMLNLRLEKMFKLADYGRLYISVDGFNITNNDTILGKRRFVNLDGFGKVTEVVAPRVFRVGVRYEY
jgi:hypothetical protein